MIIIKKYIHIWELPTNQIYIGIEKKFRLLIFKKLKKVIGNDNKVAKLIKRKNYDITVWRRGINNCPLEMILKLIKYIDIKPLKLERKIIIIKSGRNGNPSTGEIKNPKLPFRITPNMIQIVSHFLHDGSIKKDHVSYTSKSKIELKKFLNLIKYEIGNIKPSYSISNYNGITMQLPKILQILLVYGFNCKIGSKVKNNPPIPNCILKTNDKSLIKGYLKAAFSDEGSVSYSGYTRQIIFGLSKAHDGKQEPPKLLKGGYLLLKKLNITPNKMTMYKRYKTKNGEKREGWWFTLSNKNSLEQFRNNISFFQDYKNKKLDNAINSYVFK